MTYSDDWLDMSDYVVHFTKAGPAKRRAYDNLMGILGGRTLKAENGFGASRKSRGQEAVCFSEIPLGLLDRLVQRRSRYGIGFTKEFITSREGSPIWYVEKDSPQHIGLKRLLRMAEQSGEEHPLWKLTPFIDVKGDYRSGAYRWEWEREWRAGGNLKFKEEDVAFRFAPEEDHKAAWSFFSDYVYEENLGPSYHCPIFDPTWKNARIQKELEDHEVRLRELKRTSPFRWRAR